MFQRGEEGCTRLSDLGWYECYVQGWKQGLALHVHCLDVLWILLDGLLVFVFLLKLKPAWTGEFTYIKQWYLEERFQMQSSSC